MIKTVISFKSWMPNSSREKRAGYVNHFTASENLFLDEDIRCLPFGSRVLAIRIGEN
jgi:hypothetical protein